MGTENLPVSVVNPLSDKAWDDRLIAANSGSFFHTQAWARVLQETYQYIPRYFSIFDGEKLAALIPVMEINSVLTGRRGVSLPFSDYCEPLTVGKEQFQDILNFIIEYARKSGWKFLELRGGEEFQRQTVPSVAYINHTLDLAADEQKIFTNFSASARRNIRKALQNGLKTRIYRTPESLEKYYRLHCMTRKRHGLPPQPLHFFKKIYQHIIAMNGGFVALATYRQSVVAGAIYVHFGDRVMYKFGASDMAFQHLRGNNLVMWEAIRWACQKGFREFCFGRTEPHQEGLIRFKDAWGSRKHHLHYYKYDLRKAAFVREEQKSHGEGYFIFRKMPLALLKIAGEQLYRHVG